VIHTTCNPDELRRLLNDELSDPDQFQVTRHLESCARCQEQLEELAADDSVWQSTRDALSGRTPGETGDDSGPISLSFLSPSDNPAMLGRVGEFEILEQIGSGGMGIVLKGYDHHLNRFVAVKVLHPHCATSAAARRRFAREAQAAAAVVHQHVVAIHAVDDAHQPPYLVMPFVPGESLQQRLQRVGPLDVIDTVRIGQQVAEGLAAAHAQGLVHRDIKPANILLERNVDRVLLTDFGLARAADDASLTQSGVVAGTPQYMSPEQARDDAIDARTDLFSLGTVLYTLLAGHSPFRAETAMAVLRRVCEDTPRPLREINPAVPVWLEAIVSRLHAKSPADRFQSASDVADLLRRCLAHLQQPTQVRLPQELASLVRQPRRRLRRLSGILLTLTLLGVGGLVYRSLHDSAPSTNMEPTPTDLPTGWNDDVQSLQPVERAVQRLERESETDF